MSLLRPSASQVVTFAPNGTSPRFLGQLGHVTSLTYSYACPGGPDQLSATLAVDARYRTDAMNPGRICQVYRGASLIWDGKLDEPQPSADGWQILAHGAGQFGTDFDAVYTSAWGNSVFDNAVNAAIVRGLRWINPGIGAPSGIWTGQQVDSGSQTITDLLNLGCTLGGLTWYVNPRPVRNTLSVYPLPSTVTRLLVSNTPVARTLGGDINTVYVQYQNSSSSASAQTFALAVATTPSSIAVHGAMEAYLDVSSAGQLTSGQAQALGANLLERYQRASFAGPFTVAYGQYLTPGGTPVDLGSEQAGEVVRLILTDFAYGGEVTPAPIEFLVGNYSYDDTAEVGTVTPFQYLDTSFTGMLSAGQGTNVLLPAE